MEFRTVALAFSILVGLLAVVPWRLPAGHHGGAQDGLSCPLGYGKASDGAKGGVLQHAEHFGFGKTSRASRRRSSLVIYWNATVWNGSGSSGNAEAFVVDTSSRRFVYVGTQSGALAAAGSSSSAEAAGIDLQGAHVIPGLIDSHLHLIPGGLSLSAPSFAAASSRRHLAGIVAATSAQQEPGQWVVGGGWDESRWGGELPSAEWIDVVSPDWPVWLLRHDAHMGLANSVALRLAGITADTRDPPGGSILRGPDAQPTGILTDAAMQLVADRIPPLSVEQRRRAFEAGVEHALSKGITMVHDMGRIAFMEGEEAAWEDLEQVYLPAANEGRLPLRLYSFVPLTTWRRMAERVKHLGTAHPSGMLFWGGVKEFADGSLGSRTALFHEPYADQPGTSGTRTVDLEQLRQMVAAADAAGLQVAVHAIGDRAVDEVLEVYAELAVNRSAAGSSSAEQQQQQADVQRRRHRIEHAQHISGPAAAQRLASAGVIVTPNPQHLPADLPVLEARLGAERAGAGRTYAFRTLLDAGVTAACGSDWPVVPLDPLTGSLYAAVHRRAADVPSVGWAPQEALTVVQALEWHTRTGAAAASLGLEQHLGAVQAGMLADFVVLSAAPGEPQVEVLQTFVGGKCAYGCADNGAAALQA